MRNEKTAPSKSGAESKEQLQIASLFGLDHVDESNLNFIDRLGLAYCRLNTYMWDDIIGERPEGFDNLPDRGKAGCNGCKSKLDYINPAMKAIEDIIGIANTSRCWWLFVLGKSEAEWLEWFLINRVVGGFRFLKE